MDAHTVIISITAFILLITVADVITNRLVTLKNKHAVITVCLFIFLASICEYLGAKTNGAAPEWAMLHRVVKLIEFCSAPCISIAAANAYGKLVYKKSAIGVLAAHAIFEIIACFHGWVFLVDSQNIYHRERLYWIYVATFIVSILSCYLCIIRGNRKFQARFGITNYLIILFLSFGIVIQMIFGGIPIDFMCTAMGSFFLYHYRCNIINQVDATTKLLNRRCFDRSMENLNVPAYVLVFDVDNFKKINDTLGHAEGDNCLAAISQKILSVYGKYGHCYRIGGDEFCVVMVKGLDKLDRINKQFQQSIAELREQYGKLLGVSIGYSRYNQSAGTLDEILRQADTMMYENKKKRSS